MKRMSLEAESVLRLATDHEDVRIFKDPDSGLQAIIAIHSTVRGPSFGGCRYWNYSSEQAAVTDALRLSEGMTLKNALADLPFGGGKAVIMRSAAQRDRSKMFRAFGCAVNSLEGSYITAEDVGTTVADMTEVRQFTPHVSGLARLNEFGGNPSPKTAFGVFVGIRAAVRELLNRSSLDGVSVAVQGLGAVGWELCSLLRSDGCKLVVADIDHERVQAAATAFGALPIGIEGVLAAEVDVLAPCALGAVLNASSVEAVRARIVAGAANNQLALLEDGDRLHARGVFYVPDFLINAGGVISVAREHLGDTSESAVIHEVGVIADRVMELVEKVHISGEAPARVAVNWAKSKVAPRAR